MHRLQAVANGLRTDHPVPDLPFADDAHLPLDDPAAIEAIGRHEATGTWGRWDRDRSADGAWLAFTTDPIRQDLAWVVRHHPRHGRTVLVVRDEDASPWHMDWWGPQLLFRHGGYWWDGTTWHRPDQIWDAAAERYERRPVKAAVTVTADDLLDDNAHPEGGRLLKIANVDVDAPRPDVWNDHLALWAAHRPDGALPLSQCVVKLFAPELAADQLIGIPEMAAASNIAASTLRGYISRGESDVPPPQATVKGRNLWSQPVVADWVERRRHSPEAAAATLASADDDHLPVGAFELHQRLARRFLSVLWQRPDRRKRWALRYRTEPAVHEVADELAYSIAADTDSVIDTGDLALTIRHAVLDEFATSREPGDDEDTFYGIAHYVARMLDWLVRHHPETAQHTIADIVGVAEQRWGTPRHVSAQSIRTALNLDSKLDPKALRDWLDLALPQKR